jgi:hypothetical protein
MTATNVSVIATVLGGIRGTGMTTEMAIGGGTQVGKDEDAHLADYFDAR